MEHEDLLEKLKRSMTEENKEIVKDIISINGAIVIDKDVLNSKKKEELYNDVKNKYEKELASLKYHIFVDNVKEKLDKYVESDIKYINTLLGLLKTFLIRLAALTELEGIKVNNVINKIYEEENYQNLVKLYEELDDLIDNEMI